MDGHAGTSGYFRNLFLPVLMVYMTLWPMTASAGQPAHGRVSFDGGGGLVKGIGDPAWSCLTLNSLILAGDDIWAEEQGSVELEFAGGTFLRMADSSNAEIATLPPATLIRGRVGSFYLQRLQHSTGHVVFETPACQVIVERSSQVRVDVFEDGWTTVTVREGRVTVHVDCADASVNGDVVAMAGQRVYIDPGLLPSLPEPFDAGEDDALDRWNRTRADLVAGSVAAVPAGVGIKYDVIGVESLDMYGDWIRVDSEYCWRPDADEGFVPYRDGYWSYISGCGYVWVGRYPFSYITMHYGRWFYEPGAGWFWMYRSGWAPAWAATLRCGSTFVWCPIDPWGYPVSTSGDCFEVGGLNFSLLATTCCAADELLAGQCRVFACTLALAEQFIERPAEIWRIFGNISTRSPVPYTDGSLRLRDYAPRRSIRTMDSEKEKTPASLRAAALELRAPRASSLPGPVGGDNLTQTLPESRLTRVRAVNVDTERLVARPPIRSHDVVNEPPNLKPAEEPEEPRAIRAGSRRKSETGEAPPAHEAPAKETPEETAPEPLSSPPAGEARTESTPPEPTPAPTVDEPHRQRVVETLDRVNEPPEPPPTSHRPERHEEPAREIRQTVSEPSVSEPSRSVRSDSDSAAPSRELHESSSDTSRINAVDTPSAPMPVRAETPHNEPSPPRSDDSPQSVRGR